MSWVLSTLAKLLIGVCTDTFSLFADDFITKFGINIGANFPTAGSTGPSSLSSVLSSYPSSTGLTSMFDTFFPLLDFKKLFAAMGIGIATLILINELRKALSAPILGQKVQTPISSVIKYFISIGGVILSYRIFIIFEYIANGFYLQFAQIAMGIQSGNSNAGAAAMDWTMGESTKKNFTALMGYASENAGGFGGVSELTISILTLVVSWLLLFNFVKLMIEIVERYVVLGVLFYTSPLPFSALASDDTHDIFKSWLRMVVSEMILITTNSLFVGVFIGAVRSITFNSTNSTQENAALLNIGANGSVRGGTISWLIYMIMLLAWLQVAQNFDAYLRTVGLSTAQTGRGVAAAVGGGFTALAGYGFHRGTSAAGKAIADAKNSPLGKLKREADLMGGNTKAGLMDAYRKKGIEGANAYMDKRRTADALKSKGYGGAANALYGGNESAAKKGTAEFNQMQKHALDAATGLGWNAQAKSAIQNAESIKFNGDGSMSLSYGDRSSNSLTQTKDGLVTGIKGASSSSSEAYVRAREIAGNQESFGRSYARSLGEGYTYQPGSSETGVGVITDGSGDRFLIASTAAVESGYHGSVEGWTSQGAFSVMRMEEGTPLGLSGEFRVPTSELPASDVAALNSFAAGNLTDAYTATPIGEGMYAFTGPDPNGDVLLFGTTDAVNACGISDQFASLDEGDMDGYSCAVLQNDGNFKSLSDIQSYVGAAPIEAPVEAPFPEDMAERVDAALNSDSELLHHAGDIPLGTLETDAEIPTVHHASSEPAPFMQDVYDTPISEYGQNEFRRAAEKEPEGFNPTWNDAKNVLNDK